MEEELLRLMDEYGLREPAAAMAGPHPVVQPREPAEDPRARSVAAAHTAFRRRGDEPDDSGDTSTGREPTPSESARRRDVDAALIEAAHARCLDVHPYTVNEPAEMADLIALGVDGMFTNFPDRLEAVLGERSGRWQVGREAGRRSVQDLPGRLINL